MICEKFTRDFPYKIESDFFMGTKFETSWGVAPRIFKNTLLERVFEKYSQKCDFGKKSKEISVEKMKKIFLVRFSRKIEGEI